MILDQSFGESNWVWPHTAILLGCLLVTSIAQLLLKLGAGAGRGWWRNLLDWHTLSGYGLLTVVAVAMMLAMQRLDLNFVTGAQALVPVLVAVGARFVLKEALTRRRVVGVALIVAGAVVFHT